MHICEDTFGGLRRANQAAPFLPTLLLPVLAEKFDNTPSQKTREKIGPPPSKRVTYHGEKIPCSCMIKSKKKLHTSALPNS